MKSVVLLPLLGGCLFGGDTIDLELKMPSAEMQAQYLPSCVGAVEVYLNGTHYPTDSDDTTRYCINVTGKNTMTWDDVHAAIRGQFKGDYPDSGLGGVEVYGYAGGCDADNNEDFDLTFYGQAKYDGGGHLTVPVTPNLSCEQQDVRVRAIDVLKLIKTGQCAQSAWTRGKLATTTLSPMPFLTETYWWGGSSSANVATDGTAAFRASTKVGPDSMLAIANYDGGDWTALSVAGPPEQRACATGSEIEVPMIAPEVARASQDLGRATKWGGLVIGLAWGTAPLQGAQVSIDPAYAALGEIAYFDMPAGVETGTGSLTARSVSLGTGTSGLFGIYTQSAVKINITHNGRTVSRIIGGHSRDYSQVALVKI